jgi:YVTN family beta-propeller protein
MQRKKIQLVLGSILTVVMATSSAVAATSKSVGKVHHKIPGTMVIKLGKPLPGMPALLDPNDIYAADRPNALSDVVKDDPEMVYVPNHTSNTVNVIDPKTFKIIKTWKVPKGPQHVVPSWDLKTLWVNDDEGNALSPIDPKTVTIGKPVPVRDPYNLYFTPDGKYAMVMSEADQKIVFRDPHTMAIKKSVKVPCPGVNHADFTADGNYFVASCEFGGSVILMNTAKMKFLAKAKLPTIYNHMPMPQDVKLSPDGKTFYIADMASNGIWVMSASYFGKFTFIKTGIEAHGLYVTRDSKYLLISNRGEGSISVLRFSDNKLVAKWKIPGGGSPDMGGISADGTQFWISGRYNNVVYVFDIPKGKLIKVIPVDKEPHGLAIFPQPGRYSVGHTGIFR